MTTTTDRPTSVPRPDGGITIPEYAPYDHDAGELPKDKYGHPLVVGWSQTYAGAVLMKYERNGYDDSDFFAVVYDEATNSLKHVEYASTRGYTYDCGAKVDATDEVRAKARELVRAAALSRFADAAAREAREPEKGKRVRVTKGRKVAVGTEGTVVWKGVDAYKSKYGSTHYRVGVKDDAGTVHWTSADNVTVLDPEDYLPTWSDLEARAAYHARGENWRSC